MDWTTFLLGAIAGVWFWNKLNPQVRELICSLFSQGESLLFATAASAVEAATGKSNAGFDSIINRAFDSGRKRKLPEIPKELLEESDGLAQYLFYYVKGLLEPAPSIKTPPAPPNYPVTQQQ